MKHEVTAKGLRWVNVQSPEPEELAEFVRDAGLTSDDAAFVAQARRRPEITVRPSYIMLLFYIPVFDRKARITYGVALFFVVKDTQLFSLHYDPLVALDRLRQAFVESPERQEEYFDSAALSLCLYLVQSLFEGSFRKLERLTKHIEISEDAVFQGNERKMVEEISVLTRDVMDFRKIIRPQRHLLAHVPTHPFVKPEITGMWQRVNAQPEKMWEILEGMFESLKELSSTNFTLLQYKENELLRMLTIYSIIAIPMLILVDPFFDPTASGATVVDSIVFWSVVGVLVITLITLLIGLKRRGRL